MKLVRVLAALGVEESAETLAVEWAASQAAMPVGLPFLDPDFVAVACRDAGLSDEAVAGAQRAARRVGADAALRALAWHGHYCLFRAGAIARESLRRWPALDAALGADAGLFTILILLSNLPELRALYGRHGIANTVWRDTLFDVTRWAEVHRKRYGCWGLLPSRFGWLGNHVRAGIFALGRLQFQPGRFATPSVRVFRHATSGEVVALSEPGLRYRADGQFDGAGGVIDPEHAWESRLTMTDETIIGSPITPTGVALREERSLNRRDWRQALAPSDPVVNLHIPAGTPLDFAACGESMREAVAFFPRHFPDYAYVAFACSSWLLDTQLETLLPPSSNLVRFLQEFHLLPRRSSGNDALERVFGGVPPDLHQAPRDTTLRRAVLDHLLAGGHLRGARCFLFPEDLDWGGQMYRRWAAVGLSTSV